MIPHSIIHQNEMETINIIHPALGIASINSRHTHYQSIKARVQDGSMTLDELSVIINPHTSLANQLATVIDRQYISLRVANKSLHIRGFTDPGLYLTKEQIDDLVSDSTEAHRFIAQLMVHHRVEIALRIWAHYREQEYVYGSVITAYLDPKELIGLERYIFAGAYQGTLDLPIDTEPTEQATKAVRIHPAHLSIDEEGKLSTFGFSPLP